MLLKKQNLLFVFIILASGCANKFFPDKTLYQYPKTTNDVAVIYPDGSIHHSDGSVTSGEKITGSNSDEAIDSTGFSAISSINNSIKYNKQEPENTSSKKDASGRHAKYRNDK